MQLTEKLNSFLNKPISTPFLVVDLDVLAHQYRRLVTAMPNVVCHYSVKSNSAHAVLEKLFALGSCFEAASINEIHACFAAGAKANQIHFGNTIKKISDIETAYQLGVQSYAFDCYEELVKLAQYAPGCRVVCRLKNDGKGAHWGLCHKFGCSLTEAVDFLSRSVLLGLEPYGLSFHVGSQQQSPDAWHRALVDARWVADELVKQDIKIGLINLGGGYPASGYLNDSDNEVDYSMEFFGKCISESLTAIFGSWSGDLKFICEPGRYLLAEAGVVKTTVILACERMLSDQIHRWLYLDVGKFNGLYEASDIKYPVLHHADQRSDKTSTILTGPTCDSSDMLSYKNHLHHLPFTISVGDPLMFCCAGAYSNSYSCKGFNGFEPLAEYYI